MKSYAYIEVIPLDEDYDLEVDIIPCSVSRDDLFEEDIRNGGIPDDWKERLAKMTSGYYELEYNLEHETEHCDGHQIASYMILGELLKATPSYKARLNYFYRFKAAPHVYDVVALFKKVWRVEYTYGGGGTSTDSLYLPKAVWYRLTNEHPWGDCPDIKIRRSGY